VQHLNPSFRWSPPGSDARGTATTDPGARDCITLAGGRKEPLPPSRPFSPTRYAHVFGAQRTRLTAHTCTSGDRVLAAPPAGG